VTRTKLAMLSKFGLAALWLTLFTLTHIPVPPHTPIDQLGDKFEHFTAYAGLAFMIAATWELAVGRLNTRHLVIVWMVVTIYGALDEITQIPVGRDCEFGDWVADTSGALLGIAAFLVARAIVTRLFRAHSNNLEKIPPPQPSPLRGGSQTGNLN
jgi:VanZ family protein